MDFQFTHGASGKFEPIYGTTQQRFSTNASLAPWFFCGEFVYINKKHYPVLHFLAYLNHSLFIRDSFSKFLI